MAEMGSPGSAGQGLNQRVNRLPLLRGGALVAAVGCLNRGLAPRRYGFMPGFHHHGPIGSSVIAHRVFSLVGRLAAPRARRQGQSPRERCWGIRVFLWAANAGPDRRQFRAVVFAFAPPLCS